MERIAAEPEVTVCGLMTELAERGVAVSYGTVWNFIHREAMSFKKKACCRPSKIAPACAPPRALEKYQTNIRRGARGAAGSRQRSRTVTGRQ
jgi:hypothetical protein